MPPCTVKDILTNPTYIGKLRWSYGHVKRMVDGELVKTRPVDRSVHLSDGRHEPILDEVLWHRAQLMLKNRSHAPVPKSTNIRNPLAGLLICSKCGRSMERRKFKHGRDTVACPNKDCTCKSSVLEEVEAGMLDSLRIGCPTTGKNWHSPRRLSPTPAPRRSRKSPLFSVPSVPYRRRWRISITWLSRVSTPPTCFFSDPRP